MSLTSSVDTARSSLQATSDQISVVSRNIARVGDTDATRKTATIVSIGTATLAALVGAGGYGAPIVSGLSLNDVPTILTGAIPAALMAWIAHGAFEVLGKVLIPAGLQVRT